MFCLKCGKQIPDNSVYCLYCGTKLPLLEPETRSAWDIRPRTAHVHTPPEPDLPAPVSDFAKASPAVSTVAEKDTSSLLAPDTTVELPVLELRRCSVCGRELPETSISELCVTCLNNRSFVATELPDELFETLFPEEQKLSESAAQETDSSPASTAAYAAPQPTPKPDFRLDIDLDGEYPTAYAEPAPKPKREIKNPKKLAILIFIVSAALLVGGAAIAIPYLFPDTTGGSSATSQSNVDRKAVSYAHEMLKQSCANPDSVAFHKDVKSEEIDGVWSITETFDRTSKQGEFTTTTYTALLRLDSEQSSGYVPVKLRIDDTVMYDHSAG